VTVVMTVEGGCRTVVCFSLSLSLSSLFSGGMGWDRIGLDWIAKPLCLAKRRIECECDERRD